MEDVEQAYRVNLDPELSRYTGDGGVKTREQIADLIQGKILADYENYGYGRWAVIHKKSGAYLGFAGLKYLPEMELVDLGYRLDQAYWGRGLATEASLASLQFGFHELKLESVIAMVMPANRASSRVAEKLGFERYDQMSEDGEDIDLYRLSRNHFLSRESALKERYS